MKSKVSYSNMLKDLNRSVKPVEKISFIKNTGLFLYGREKSLITLKAKYF